LYPDEPDGLKTFNRDNDESSIKDDSVSACPGVRNATGLHLPCILDKVLYVTRVQVVL
jgi:hypothetical protein